MELTPLFCGRPLHASYPNLHAAAIGSGERIVGQNAKSDTHAASGKWTAGGEGGGRGWRHTVIAVFTFAVVQRPEFKYDDETDCGRDKAVLVDRACPCLMLEGRSVFRLERTAINQH